MPLVHSSSSNRQHTYQNLLLARMASGAHTFMRYTVGVGSCSVGMWRPTTWYWWNLWIPWVDVC
jgi:hypothetical protein